ncbi:MAG: hypothetical protein FWH14_06005 [Oscillospiraceae bacterium]|nr:hypothetical protein [Oscillospiraceae bacterium]
MRTNTVLKSDGMRILAEHLGIVEAERFITLLRREPFNYTEWQREHFKDLTLDKFLSDTQEYREELHVQ